MSCCVEVLLAVWCRSIVRSNGERWAESFDKRESMQASLWKPWTADQTRQPSEMSAAGNLHDVFGLEPHKAERG